MVLNDFSTKLLTPSYNFMLQLTHMATSNAVKMNIEYNHMKQEKTRKMKKNRVIGSGSKGWVLLIL
jgi:hypothetical protein